jgi:outer membrane phospholipase A
MISRSFLIGAAFCFMQAAPFLFMPEESVAQSTASGAPVGVLASDPELLRLTGHKGIYFVYGNPSGKVQLSAKHQMLEGHEAYVAYTQTMLWEFQRESTPFSDVNFNPELFYRFHLSPSASLDVSPFEHVSNGRDGLASRGLNDLYARLSESWNFERVRFDGGVKVFAFWGLDQNNSDLRDYCGFWNGSLSASFTDVVLPFWQVYAKISPGSPWGNRIERGNQEFGLSMKFDRSSTLPFLYIQYFNGYGESLLTYNQNSSAIRIGVRR